MSGSSAPAPGWYVDPETKNQLRWWDGSQWLAQFAPIPAPVPTLPPPAPGEQPITVAGPVPISSQYSHAQRQDEEEEQTFTEKAQDFLNNPLVQGAAIGVAGTALGATGVVSLKKDRRTSRVFLISLIAFAVGLFMLFTNAGSPAVASPEATVMGTVVKVTPSQEGLFEMCYPTIEYEVNGTKFTHKPASPDICSAEVGDTVTISYNVANGPYDARVGAAKPGKDGVSYMPISALLTIVGFIVAAWSGVSLAVRAGSVVGGLALLLAGFHRAAKRD